MLAGITLKKKPHVATETTMGAAPRAGCRLRPRHDSTAPFANLQLHGLQRWRHAAFFLIAERRGYQTKVGVTASAATKSADHEV